MSEHVLSVGPGAVAQPGSKNELLQRKCRCGQHTVMGGECKECSKKRRALQRSHGGSVSAGQRGRRLPGSQESRTPPFLSDEDDELSLERLRDPDLRLAGFDGPSGVPATPAFLDASTTRTGMRSQRTPPAPTSAHPRIQGTGPGRVCPSPRAIHAGTVAGTAVRTLRDDGAPAFLPSRLRPGHPPKANPQSMPLPSSKPEINRYPAITRPLDRILFKARSDRVRTDDPLAILEQLDEGRPLDGGVRTRMEAAFGSDFGHVRVHNSAKAAQLSSRLQARAFTVGKDVAFAAGEYRPGTPVGDALIAHELAHVIQQDRPATGTAPMRMGDQGYRALEADADRAAASVVQALWSGGTESPAGGEEARTPAVSAGLRLQRCSTCTAGATSTKPNTIVCDGNGGIRVKVTSVGGAAGQKCGLVDCATQHEQSHRVDTLAECPDVCEGRADGDRITMDASERARQEVKASDIEITCLQGHLAKHKKSGDSACQTMVEARITQMEKYRDSFK